MSGCIIEGGISTMELTWIKEIEMSYEHDLVALQLITKLITTPRAKPKFTLTQRVIRFEENIFVGR